jgi:hypothetical protein
LSYVCPLLQKLILEWASLFILCGVWGCRNPEHIFWSRSLRL